RQCGSRGRRQEGLLDYSGRSEVPGREQERGGGHLRAHPGLRVELPERVDDGCKSRVWSGCSRHLYDTTVAVWRQVRDYGAQRNPRARSQRDRGAVEEEVLLVA